MKLPVLILISGLLLALASDARAATGEFQTTKNGKTMVWNSAPKAGDTATWNGDRDRDGYASGFGTLTWYTAKGGSKAAVYGIYYGNMVHGKFEGPVNVHVKNKTAHAVFTDGVRTSRWVGGPAANFKVAQQSQAPEAKPAKEEIEERPTPKLEADSTPKAPKPETERTPAREEAKAETTPTPAPPVVAEKREEPIPQNSPAEPSEPVQAKPSPAPKPSASPRAVAKKPAATPPNQKVRDKYDDSLRALVGPPRSLRADSVPKSAAKAAPTPSAEPSAAKPAATPRMADLAEEDVIELADAEALKQGYDLGNYLSPKLDYSKAKEKWTVFYDSKGSDPNGEAPKSLVIGVEDKTKKASVASHK